MKRITEIAVFSVLLLGASLLLCARPVLADAISDSLTVYSPSGKAVASVSASEAGEDPNHAYIIPYTGIVNEQLFGDPTVLLDPDGKVSDVFGIYEQDDNLYLAFESASGTSAPAFGASDRIFPEGNGVFDATLYLSPGLQQDGYTATFISETNQVPEPSTLVTLAIGLVVLFGTATRKRASAKVP
jgi:hypothetical protein